MYYLDPLDVIFASQEELGHERIHYLQVSRPGGEEEGSPGHTHTCTHRH